MKNKRRLPPAAPWVGGAAVQKLLRKYFRADLSSSLSVGRATEVEPEVLLFSSDDGIAGFKKPYVTDSNFFAP